MCYRRGHIAQLLVSVCEKLFRVGFFRRDELLCPLKFSHPLGGLSLVNICVTEMCVGRGGKWIKLNCVLITFQRLSDQPFPMVKLAKPLKALAVFRVQTHRSLKGLRRRVILLLPE